MTLYFPFIFLHKVLVSSFLQSQLYRHHRHRQHLRLPSQAAEFCKLCSCKKGAHHQHASQLELMDVCCDVRCDLSEQRNGEKNHRKINTSTMTFKSGLPRVNPFFHGSPKKWAGWVDRNIKGNPSAFQLIFLFLHVFYSNHLSKNK